MEHGDAFCTLDEKYQAFRAQSRHPLWQQGMLAKPLAERVQIAEAWRAQSRMANSNKPENIMDVTPQAVIDTMIVKNVTLMVHGHTHRPQVHELNLGDKSGQRLVLGDWREDEGKAVIAMADEKGIRLSDWSF